MPHGNHPASDSGTSGTGTGDLITIKLTSLCSLALISLALTDRFLLLRGADPLSSDLHAQHILLLLLQTSCVASLNYYFRPPATPYLNTVYP
jgi:hypothetical protein